MFSINLFGKVQTPSYESILKAFDDFMPSQNFETIEKKYGKGKLQNLNKTLTEYKFNLKAQGFTFPIFIQVYQSKVVDFFSKLPSFFITTNFIKQLLKDTENKNPISIKKITLFISGKIILTNLSIVAHAH